MTSTSSLGTTTINVQFALSRNIDAAAQDISAAIAAALGVLPPEMPNPPTFVKVNPADMPVMVLALTSATLPLTTVSDLGESLIIASLSMLEGVGKIDLAPPQKYAVRVQLNPDALAHRGIGIDEVAEALRAGNVNLPGGTLDGPVSAYTLNPEGRLLNAAAFRDLVVRYQERLNAVLLADPDGRTANVASTVGFISDNAGLAFLSLRTAAEREHSVDAIIARLRPQLNAIPGLNVSLVNPPLITIGSRLTSAQWQLALQGNDLADLQRYGALMEDRLKGLGDLIDVKSDLQVRQPRVEIQIDRDQAAALGLSLRQIQDAFYSAYGQRQVSTIYAAANYYYVVLELDPAHRADPDALEGLYLRTRGGELVPLRAVARLTETVAPRTVNHLGQLPSVTISFNLKPQAAIGPAILEIERLARETLPAGVHAVFQGTAQAFQTSLASMGFLLIITLLVIYMVLGVLYESFLHPLTILTAPAPGGLRRPGGPQATGPGSGHVRLRGHHHAHRHRQEERHHDGGLRPGGGARPGPEQPGGHPCRLPDVLPAHHDDHPRRPVRHPAPSPSGGGAGGEARQSLGVAVVGGLLFSQLLTLFVTPVFYLYVDQFSRWLARRRRTAGGVADLSCQEEGEGVSR